CLLPVVVDYSFLSSSLGWTCCCCCIAGCSAGGGGTVRAQNRRSLYIDPVHLKNMLRQVQSDRSNLAHGWLPFAAVSIRQQFGTQMPQGGHPPHHSITSSARASSVSGTSRPSALAVLRLTTSSNLTGA